MQNEQQASITQPIQTILLIVLESFLTLILRFDNQLRQSAYPLAINGTVLAVRSYLPHDEIYVTFSFKGLLIDSELPANKQRPDVIINAHSFEIINAIISNKPQAVNKLQFRGEDEQVGLVRAFLLDLSVNQLLNNTLNRFINRQTAKNNNSDNFPNSSSTNHSTDESDNVKNSVDDTNVKKEAQKHTLLNLREENNQLTIINQKQRTQLAELASRKRFFSFLSLLTFIVGFASGFFVYWLVL